MGPLLPRNDFGLGLTNGESDEGGFEVFRLFCRSCHRSSATSARSSTATARKPNDRLPQLGVLRSKPVVGQPQIGLLPSIGIVDH